MASRHRDWWTIPAAAILLLWPAIWNRYPIVFADTGTYLSQAIHRYAGWDRPVFYSLFIFPLHAKLSLWPIVAAQALLAAWVLRCVCRLAAPRLAPWAFMVLIVGLAIGTWLPWLVSEVMPDLFTPLLVLALWLLAWQAAQLTGREIVGLSGLATFAIAAQQSSLPLSMVLIGAAVAGARSVSRRPLALLLPLVVAIVALCGVNLAAHGRFSVSPFGNVFLLARSLYDGPGMEALRRDCPTSGWRLCAFVDRMPRSSDAFLWDSDSPLQLAGGPKQVSGEANAIIASGLRAEPAGSARAALRNSADQVTRFASGDGLEPWPRQVTPVITGDFPPAEATRYTGARQQGGKLSVPSLLAELHKAVAVACAAAGVLLLPGIWRRRRSIAGLLMLVLLALPVNAAITGVFSGPHDRYQARLMWLPVFVVPLVAAAFAPRPSVLRTSVPRMSRPFPSRPSPSRPSPSRPSPSRPSPSCPGPTGPS
ncbi:MAG TPA: hypothetical protein VHB27_06285, partial [Rhodopila sp.]|uniref:hypothetical protein n=1 Tax=Rhodopila sp. TaxID=2480087 RepID=UPI002CD3BAAB